MRYEKEIKNIARLLIAVAIIVPFVLCLRCYLVSSYRISTLSMEKALYKGDCILVNKWKHKPAKNDVVLFYVPSKVAIDELLISRCVGTPGDIIVKDNVKLVVPQKGRPYRLDETNINFCKNAIVNEAGYKARFHDGKLYLDGRETTFFFFKQDYYWMLSDNVDEAIDSRHLGFIPSGNIIGTASFIWLSKTPERIFKLVK
jgi:signal peptidase I, bacterial type